MKKKTHEEIWKVLIDLAQRCDVDYHTAHKQKERGYIPPSHHYNIVQEAQKAGLEWVTHSFLHDMWQSKTKWKNRRTK